MQRKQQLFICLSLNLHSFFPRVTRLLRRLANTGMHLSFSRKCVTREKAFFLRTPMYGSRWVQTRLQHGRSSKEGAPGRRLMHKGRPHRPHSVPRQNRAWIKPYAKTHHNFKQVQFKHGKFPRFSARSR